MSLFYVSRVIASLMIVTCQLYCLYDSSSMVYLVQTLQHGVVSFQAYGWMFAGMGPI